MPEIEITNGPDCLQLVTALLQPSGSNTVTFDTPAGLKTVHIERLFREDGSGHRFNFESPETEHGFYDCKDHKGHGVFR